MSLKNLLTFRQRVLQSGTWTLVGYGAAQALRFVGNIILARLLFPEAFGMMAILQIVMYGVGMVTDVGIITSIVQQKRGNDPVFLNTAWTVQAIRGFALWLVLCALALPISHFYHEPMLAGMLAVIGLNAIIGGFNSTKLYSAQRNLEAGRVTLIEFGSSALGLLFTIYLAWYTRSVWALVLGNICTAFLKMIASHFGLHGERNKFAWEIDALKHLRGFGRWIMLSSILTFLSVEGARLMVSALLDMRQLALYTMASAMSLMFWQIIQQLGSRVLFPAFSEINRNNPRDLNRFLFRSRLMITFPSWGLAVLFVFFGAQVMHFLYDNRYQDSGGMLQLLATGTLVSCVWGSYGSALWSIGKVATMTILTAIQIAIQFASMYVGFHYWREAGIVMGVAAANWIVYPAYAFAVYRNGLWHPRLDTILIASSVLVVVLAWPRLGLINNF